MNTRRIAFAGAVGALYAGLTIALAPISYGAVQFRVSEALCILPFFFPWASWGLFVGCIVANLVSTIGIIDVVFGSLATLASAMVTARLGHRNNVGAKIAVCVSPVLFNGVVIGAILALASTEKSFFAAFIANGATVALGEAAVMAVIGFPMLMLFPKTSAYKYLKEHE